MARAADGSVRDGLSLLDQAIALGGGAVTAVQVRDMLGLADRARILDLFEAAVSARPAEALDILSDLHRVGADPLVILQDLLDLVHSLTRLKVIPDTANDPSMPEAERTRGRDMSAKLSMPALTRAWQLLLKGLGEVQAAPIPQQALEMVIVRLSYAADLPTPGELIRQLQNAGASSNGGSGGSAPRTPGGGPVAIARGGAARAVGGRAVEAAAQPAEAVAAARPEDWAPMPRDYRTLVQLFAERREGALYGHLFGAAHLVRMEPGRLEIRPEPMAPGNLANRVGQLLSEWTGQRWVVVVSDRPGEPTLKQQEDAALQRALDEAAANPVVRAVLDSFDGARILDVRDLAAAAAAAAAEAAVADEPDSDDINVRDALLYPLDEMSDLGDE